MLYISTTGIDVKADNHHFQVQISLVEVKNCHHFLSKSMLTSSRKGYLEGCITADFTLDNEIKSLIVF